MSDAIEFYLRKLEEGGNRLPKTTPSDSKSNQTMLDLPTVELMMDMLVSCCEVPGATDLLIKNLNEHKRHWITTLAKPKLSDIFDLMEHMYGLISAAGTTVNQSRAGGHTFCWVVHTPASIDEIVCFLKMCRDQFRATNPGMWSLTPRVTIPMCGFGLLDLTLIAYGVEVYSSDLCPPDEVDSFVRARRLEATDAVRDADPKIPLLFQRPDYIADRYAEDPAAIALATYIDRGGVALVIIGEGRGYSCASGGFFDLIERYFDRTGGKPTPVGYNRNRDSVQFYLRKK
jgi:hypothetical protein